MRPMMRKTGAVMAALSLTLGAAACSDDDDDGDEDAAPVAEADAAAFCDSFVEFNSAVLEVELDDESSEDDVKATGEELAPTFQTITDNAPDELADQAEELNGAIQALLEGDAEEFNADSTFESYSEFSGGAVEACEFETVAVTGVDYAFEGAPATIPAGTVAFDFTNASEAEEHELILLKRPDGEAREFSELLALPEEEAETAVEFRGAAFAPPGASGSTVAELDPGSYAMACFIPVGGAEEGPPHFTQGMVAEFTVE